MKRRWFSDFAHEVARADKDATQITFINEIADLCEKVGADVRGIGLENRIGGKFLNAGPGYGSSCLPKATVALRKSAQDFEARQRIVEAVVAVNENRKRAVGRKVIESVRLGPCPGRFAQSLCKRRSSQYDHLPSAVGGGSTLAAIGNLA